MCLWFLRETVTPNWTREISSFIKRTIFILLPSYFIWNLEWERGERLGQWQSVPVTVLFVTPESHERIRRRPTVFSTHQGRKNQIVKVRYQFRNLFLRRSLFVVDHLWVDRAHLRYDLLAAAYRDLLMDRRNVRLGGAHSGRGSWRTGLHHIHPLVTYCESSHFHCKHTVQDRFDFDSFLLLPPFP